MVQPSIASQYSINPNNMDGRGSALWRRIKQYKYMYILALPGILIGAKHSLSEFAEMVGLSPSYLSKLFKKELGITFVEYVMESKVSSAKKLLVETEYSVMEIAEMVGYSERNLNRAFQRFAQMSPNQYRLSQL